MKTGWLSTEEHINEIKGNLADIEKTQAEET